MHAPLKLKSDYINVLLDLAAQRTRERGDRAYGQTLGVPLRDVRLLRMVGTSPGIAMGALAEQSGLEKTLASKVVGSLVQRGLVTREIGQKDARNVHLALSAEGIALVKRAEPLGRQLETGFERWLSREELRALHATLQKIVDAEQASREQFDLWVEQLPTPATD